MSNDLSTSDAERPVIVWFRDDLRLSDNPALHAAAQCGRRIVCLFVYDEESEGLRRLGGAARWWLHGSLKQLDENLRSQGGCLSIHRGPASATILELAATSRAAAVFWNRRYGAAERRIDEAVKTALTRQKIEAKSFNGHLLYEPWSIKAKSGGPFRVFSAFWRAAHEAGEPALPLRAPSKLEFFEGERRAAPSSVGLAELALEPSFPDWSGGLRSNWQRGEAGARAQLEYFLGKHFDEYAACRDYPSRQATSQLSPYLRFGNISAGQVWHAATAAASATSHLTANRDLEKFRSELGWREFSYHLLYNTPDMTTRNLQPKFDGMRWRNEASALKAWQKGKTGFPIVDAGMRELWATGWMHNRVRMVVASFLIKDLLIDWRCGEAWFWDTLVDADPANNAASWQWVAGSGADAAPYFRVFNPVLQGEKFDPEGNYVKRWLPELADVSPSVVHRPWQSTDKTAGYPARIVDHDQARRRALSAYGDLS